MKFKKWSIWRANLSPVIGSEQGKSRVLSRSSELISYEIDLIDKKAYAAYFNYWNDKLVAK